MSEDIKLLIRTIHWFGAALYAIAFFLPAWDFGATGGILYGYQSAVAVFLPLVWIHNPLLGIAIVAINPIVTLNLAFSITRKKTEVRPYLGLGSLVCLIGTSIWLHSMLVGSNTLEIGCKLWVTGILLMIPASFVKKSE